MAAEPTVKFDTIRLNFRDVGPGWETWILSAPDVHWDNPHTDRNLFRKHMDQVVKRDGIAIFPGDFFCAMQGKWDPRKTKEDLRPEHQNGDYLDSLVRTATDWFEPYRDHIGFISMGNHEVGILNRHETNLTARLCSALDVPQGGYSGFLDILTESAAGGNRRRHRAFWHHGDGVGGEVTKGALRTDRWGSWVEGVDILIGGHIHQSWVIWTSALTALASGRQELVDRAHICSSTYKQEYEMQGTWHVRKGRRPRPIGGTWIHFYYDRSARGRVKFNAFRAI